ncbi:MAG: tripartite tricarboxylate transporter substrate binding protein BugD [Pseudolabrys sp.]|nr:tripartite tricarboxylate transporter substrate binding protein BugD [Pseudolabrys sp.]MSP31468.1 tripartite tricarboxylate transporter substrate binding protein BugD [Pseudolabrys sp.]
MKKIFLFAAAVLAPLALGGLTPVHAQSYPAHNITMIVPFPPGGPSDIVARIAAEGMSRHLGQNIVIENVGGAGGTIGATRAAESKPDGYTVFAASMGTIIAAPTFYPNLKYDSTKDFEPVGMSANAPAAVSIKNDIPAKNLKEFVAWAKKNGVNVKQAHGGVGGTSHMACLLFNQVFDLKPTLVAYRGMGPGMNDLMGGHIDYLCEQALVMAAAIQGDKVRGIVVAGNERLAAIPNVPSAKEAGAAAFQLNIWSAIYAPKGTPKDIVAKLAAALDKTLDEPSTKEKLGKLGGTVPPKADRGPDHLRKTVASDIPRWAPILKEAAAATKSN